MTIISVLPENVANQIAAGEVIERPSNVVKELIENSLDAHAKSVRVSFRNGGSSFIQVQDDGDGMSEEDAILCFKRHATSKLKTIGDLRNIHSFGFRGEALPSIASIAKVRMQTCRVDDSLGTSIEIYDSEIREKKPCAANVGTTITVEQLFYNVPVRRKFLKSESTESAHIIECVRLYALAYPKVHFSLMENGREVFSSPQCSLLEERIQEIWPRRDCKTWLTLQYEKDEVKLHGLTCPPGQGYSTSHDIYLFLNDRPIASGFILGVIRECYRLYLPPKTYPSTFLFLHLPGEDVDVNVHPTKREVRFKHEKKLRQVVFDALTETLTRVNAFERVYKDPGEPNPFANKVQNWTCDDDFSQRCKPVWDKPAVSLTDCFELQSQGKSESASVESDTTSDKELLPELEPVEETELAAKFETNLRFLAIWQNHYALWEGDQNLCVFDFKAAQVRIVYEKVCWQLKNQGIPLQNLLLPYTFSLPLTQQSLLQQHLHFINSKHFCSIRFLADKTFLLDALPVGVDFNNLEGFIADLLTMLQMCSSDTTSTWLHDWALWVARHSSWPVRDEFSVREVLNQLQACQNALLSVEGQMLWRSLKLKDFQANIPSLSRG